MVGIEILINRLHLGPFFHSESRGYREVLVTPARPARIGYLAGRRDVPFDNRAHHGIELVRVLPHHFEHVGTRELKSLFSPFGIQSFPSHIAVGAAPRTLLAPKQQTCLA